MVSFANGEPPTVIQLVAGLEWLQKTWRDLVILWKNCPDVLKLAMVYIKSIHCPSFLRNDFSKRVVCEWIRD